MHPQRMHEIVGPAMTEIQLLVFGVVCAICVAFIILAELEEDAEE